MPAAIDPVQSVRDGLVLVPRGSRSITKSESSSLSRSESAALSVPAVQSGGKRTLSQYPVLKLSKMLKVFVAVSH